MAIIDGTEGDDVLTGTDEADEIKGLAGDDVIDGGLGPDILRGGDGDDTFRFTRVSLTSPAPPEDSAVQMPSQPSRASAS